MRFLLILFMGLSFSYGLQADNGKYCYWERSAGPAKGQVNYVFPDRYSSSTIKYNRAFSHSGQSESEFSRKCIEAYEEEEAVCFIAVDGKIQMAMQDSAGTFDNVEDVKKDLRKDLLKECEANFGEDSCNKRNISCYPDGTFS